MQNKIITFIREWGLLVVAAWSTIPPFIVAIIALIKHLSDSGKSSYEAARTQSEANLNDAQAELTIAQAQSLEFNDHLTAIEIVHKLIRDGFALEQLLTRKNEIIAELEDKIFSQNQLIEEQSAQLEAYEGQKMTIAGTRLVEQGRGKKR